MTISILSVFGVSAAKVEVFDSLANFVMQTGTDSGTGAKSYVEPLNSNDFVGVVYNFDQKVLGFSAVFINGDRMIEFTMATKRDFSSDYELNTSYHIGDLNLNPNFLCPNGHSYGEYVYNNDATLKADGTKTAVCNVCHYKNTIVAEGTKKEIPEPDPETGLIDTSLVFEDVKKENWFKTAIDFAFTNGILEGFDDGLMKPNNQLTRAQLVQIFANIEGIDTTDKNVETIFTDVKSGSWYAPAVKWANENGIVDGVGDNRYNPNGVLTRKQFCKMIISYADYKQIELEYNNEPKVFSDQDEINGWAKEYIEKCVTSGLMNGVTDNVFKPNGMMTRAQVATVIMRFSEAYLTTTPDDDIPLE